MDVVKLVHQVLSLQQMEHGHTQLGVLVLQGHRPEPLHVMQLVEEHVVLKIHFLSLVLLV